MHKRGIHFFAFLGLLLLTAACRKTSNPNLLLAQAERLVMTSPDSVKAYEDLLRAAILMADEQEDWHTCSRACLLLSRQVQWTHENEALSLAYKALDAHRRASIGGKTDSAECLRLDILLAMAGYLQQTGENTRARSTLNRILVDARQLGLITRQNAALGQMAHLCLNEGNPQEALALAKQMHLTNDATTDLEAQFILANCYLQCDSPEQARHIYNQLDTRQNYKARYVALRHLAEIAMMQRDYEQAPLLVDTAFDSAEEVFFQALRQKDEYHRAVLEQERAAEKIASRQRLIQGSLVAFGVVGLLTILYVASLHRQRQAVQRQRLETAQRERELAEQRLRHEAELRRRETAEREREAREAEEQLTRQRSMIRLLQNFIIEKSEVINRLRAEGNKKILLSHQDWAEVEQTLDSITGGFVARLRTQHPGFSEEDVQLCMLTRMNLPNQSIAQIYLITVSAVKHRKLKLKKDGFGERNPERPLDDVVANI